MCHLAMVVALHLVEFHVLVAHHLEQAPEVGLLFVASEEFEFAVSRNDDYGRCIGTAEGERGILVDKCWKGVSPFCLRTL